jgi:hypothetical protein
MGTVTCRAGNYIYVVLDGEADEGDETGFPVDQAIADKWDEHIGKAVTITFEVLDIPGKYEDA